MSFPKGERPQQKVVTFLRSASRIFEKEWVERNSIRLLVSILIFATLMVARTIVKKIDPPPFKDKAGNWVIATSLVQGEGYSLCVPDYFPFCGPSNQVTATREPIPVLLMAGAMLIYPSQTMGLILLGLLYVGTTVAIFLILGNQDRRLALLASILWVGSMPVIEQIADDTGELAAAFFLAWGLLYFQKGRKGHQTKDWILSGLFLGLASLSRTVLFGVSIGLFIGLLVEQAKKFTPGWQERLKPILLFFVMLCLPMTSWVIRNKIALGSPVIGSTLTGYNVYRMNSILADENFRPRYVGWQEGLKNVTALIEQGNLTGTENEAQMQSFYMKAGLQIIAAHPVRYVELSLYRFLPLWFNFSIEQAYGETSPDKEDYVNAIEQIILLVGVILGASRNQKENWVLILGLLLGVGAYMAIDAQQRYLVDLMPMIVILASFSLPNMKLLTRRAS